MRTRSLVVLLACVLVLGLLVPAAAGASFSSSRSQSADAWWSSWDWEMGVEPGPNDPVTERGISGFSGNFVWKDGGMAAETLRETNGSVWMYSYTPATATEPRTWWEFSCFSMTPDFLVGRKLTSASLSFMAPAEIRIWRGTEPWVEVDGDFTQRDPDEVIAVSMVSVEGAWKPAGAMSRQQYLMRERTEDFRYADRTLQYYRDASTMVSVVGSDGTVYWAETVAGSMSDSKGGGRYPF